MRSLVSERIWDTAVLVFNAALVLVFLVAFWSLWGKSSAHLEAAGGLPPLSVDAVRSLAGEGGAALVRIEHWGLSWVYGVFAVGSLILTVSGVRFLIVSIRRYL
jgi:hypothetical protein